VHLNPKDIKHLKGVFKTLDKNGDGSLNLEELKIGLQDIKCGEDLLVLM
jgi:Ca2+-binding EF-hand superfamily protein